MVTKHISTIFKTLLLSDTALLRVTLGEGGKMSFVTNKHKFYGRNQFLLSTSMWKALFQVLCYSHGK